MSTHAVLIFDERSELLINHNREKSTQKTCAVTKKSAPSSTAAQLQNIYELLTRRELGIHTKNRIRRRQKARDPHTEQNTQNGGGSTPHCASQARGTAPCVVWTRIMCSVFSTLTPATCEQRSLLLRNVHNCNNTTPSLLQTEPEEWHGLTPNARKNRTECASV